MRLLLAARLSQDKSGQTGLDTQDADARAWAERTGHEVIATAADKISGRTSPLDRPNLGPWLTDPALMSKYDGIIVSKLDRLSRGRDWGIRQWAEKHGKKLLVVSPELCWPPEPGDTATPLIWDNLVNIASAEWENTSLRYRRMQAHLRDVKSLVGRNPFGYKVSGEAKAKTLVPDPVEADAIRTVVTLYLGGKSLRYLCAYLDEAGIPPPAGGKWAPKSLAKLLRNSTLMGRRVDASGRTVMKVPPILDLETWNRLQAELDRKASRKGVAPTNTALLTGIAVCAVCGGPMYRIRCGRKRADGSLADYWYYRCAGAAGRAGSNCRNMYPLEELEERVEKYMTGTMARWPRYETVTTPGHGHEEEIYETERDIRDLDFDDPEYASKHAALLAERARLRGLPHVPARTERRKTSGTIGQHWATLETDADKRAFLLELGMTIRVRRGAVIPGPGRVREKDSALFEVFGAGADYDQFLGGKLHDQADDEA
jgi:site-specific DNA recombinase